jgi:hypothetical protein
MDLDVARPALDTHNFGSAPGYVATFKGDKWLYLTADNSTPSSGPGRKPAPSRKN